MTPESIEGWVLFQDDPVKYPAWSARCPTDDEVSVSIGGGFFSFSDETQYYPGGGIDVPMAVVWRLIELSGEVKPCDQRKLVCQWRPEDDEGLPLGSECGETATHVSCVPYVNAPTCDAHACRCATALAASQPSKGAT